MLSLTVISAFTSTCHKYAANYVRNFRRMRRHLALPTLPTAKIISVILINSQPDYCNSLLNIIANKTYPNSNVYNVFKMRVV